MRTPEGHTVVVNMADCGKGHVLSCRMRTWGTTNYVSPSGQGKGKGGEEG